MKPLTREELVAKLARRWRVRHHVAEERIGPVLDEVVAMLYPRLCNDWSAVEVFAVLRAWRGGRMPGNGK